MNVATDISTIDLTASEIVEGVASKSLDPVKVVDDVLARIEKLEPELHAWAYVDADGARKTAVAMAAEAKAGKLRGPLHGMPIGIKDVLHVEGMPTVANSKTMDPAKRYPDSGVAKALRNAGAIIIGKCATVEFAGAGDPPTSRNAWNHAHTPGGSSSGSGAAVGGKMVPAAIGTQTGGSNLRPAAYNGVAGFKPTYGALSRVGVLPLSWTFDHPGIIARSAADCGLIFRAIAKQPPAKEESQRKWKIGLLRPFFLEKSEPDMVAATEAAAKKLAEAGCIVTEPKLPDMFKHHQAVQRLLTSTETQTYHSRRYAEQKDQMVRKHQLAYEAQQLLPATYYLQALRARRIIREQWLALFQDFDLFIMPTAPGGAPEGISSTGSAIFLSPWSQAGFPAATVPSGISAKGLPLGLQIVGPAGADGRVLAAQEFAEGVLGRLTLPA